MIDLDELKEKLKDFSDNKPMILAIIGLIVFLFVAGLIILCIQTSSPKKEPVKQPETVKLDAPVLLPSPPEIEKDYFPSRTTENQWSKSEIDQWFTYPDESLMSDLEKTNNKIMNDILGAAP